MSTMTSNPKDKAPLLEALRPTTSALKQASQSLERANAKTLDEQSLHSSHEAFMQHYEHGLSLLDDHDNQEN